MTDYIDMIEYMANLVGIDHVGLGLDLVPFWTEEDYEPFIKSYGIALCYPHKTKPFDQKYVEGFKDVEDTISITEELLRRGFSDDDTKKVLGGNWLRLLKQVWK
jgi:membrane dipeptidase